MISILKKVSQLFLLLALSFNAQNQDLFFTQTNIIDGLPGDHPFRLIQDRFGYIWMTAETGVFRYDGYEYINFMFDEKDPKSFSGEGGGSICEDAFGRIWISHRDGLEYYDYNSSGFIKYRGMPDSLVGYISTMAASKDSTLYLSMGRNGLYKIEKNGEFNKVKIPMGNKSIYFVKDHSELIFFDRSERLWISQFNYFILYDFKSKDITKIYLDKSIEIDTNNSSDNKFFYENSYWIESVFQFDDKELWIGTKDGKIFVVSLEGDFNSEEFVMSNELKQLLEGREISDLFISEENKLWITTDDFRTGLIIVNLKEGSYEYHEGRSGVPGYISRNRIHQIFQDSFNTIWLPVGRGGLVRWDPYANKFKENFDGTENNLKSRLGRFLEMEDGIFLISDRSANIYKYNFRNSTLISLGSYVENRDVIESDIIRFIYKWKDDTYFFHTYSGDRYEFNSVSNKFKKHKSLDKNIELGSAIIGKHDIIWYSGSAENKSAIISYNILTGKSDIHFPIKDEVPHPNFNYTYSTLEDRFGKIWAGTNGKGFFRFDPNNNEWLKVDHPLLTTPRIAYEASDGNIWVGASKGLFVISTNGEIIKKFTTRDGLLHEMVYEITEDNEKNIWVQTERGISRINLENFRIRNFDKNDGYPVLSSNYDLAKITNGNLLFISDYNLISLDPQNIRDNKVAPSVSLTGLTISGKNISPDSSDILNSYIGTTTKIDLEYNQNDIEIDYVGIHYSRPERINYGYFLQGYDPEWNMVGDVRSARYTNLPAGEYIFKVKAQNADGFWNDNPIELTIIIHPPYWQTWWAYSFYFIMVVGILYTVRKFELNRQRKNSEIKEGKLRAEAAEMQARAIQAENDRKTKELEEARKLQLSMLPKEIPQLPNLDIAVYMKTATEVGGDYYDFRLSVDGTLNVALGDATGHGLQAGTLVTIMKGIFTLEAENSEVLPFLQKSVAAIKEIKLGRLMMAFVFLKIKGTQLSLSNAGVPPVYIFRSVKNEVEEIDNKGMPLGAMSNFPYKETKTNLNKGDVIFLLSDGYPELSNRNKEMFGYERVKNTFKEIAENTAEEIIKHLKNTAKEWINGNVPDDDVTFVIIKIK